MPGKSNRGLNPQQLRDGGSDVEGRVHAMLSRFKPWRRNVRYPVAGMPAGPAEWHRTDEAEPWVLHRCGHIAPDDQQIRFRNRQCQWIRGQRPLNPGDRRLAGPRVAAFTEQGLDRPASLLVPARFHDAVPLTAPKIDADASVEERRKRERRRDQDRSGLVHRRSALRSHRRRRPRRHWAPRRAHVCSAQGQLRLRQGLHGPLAPARARNPSRLLKRAGANA